MSKKTYIGKFEFENAKEKSIVFEFDKEERNIIIDALSSYEIISRRLNKRYHEICTYVLIKFRDLKEKQF